MIDNVVFEFMQSIESPFMTNFMKFISILTEPLVLLFVSLILGFYIYLKKSKKEGVFFISVMLVASILVKILKEIFQRARPLDSLIVETGYSLPSGHALISLVFFGLVAYLLISKKRIWLRSFVMFFVPLLIGFSRLYLGVHWFTDVLVGYILGVIILTIGILIYRRYSQVQ